MKYKPIFKVKCKMLSESKINIGGIFIFLSSDIPVLSFLLWFQKFVDQCYQVKELIELFLFQKDETKVKEI
jgi:hypothetical protein